MVCAIAPETVLPPDFRPYLDHASFPQPCWSDGRRDMPYDKWRDLLQEKIGLFIQVVSRLISIQPAGK
jgi:hypothetical protein